MKKFKCIVLLLGIILPTAIGLANSGTTKEKDGGCPVVINKSKNTESDRSGSISASIDGHNLTIIFLANLGQVTIKVLDAYDVEIELMSTPTPTGQIIYIPLAGRYTVLFTLSDGDVYYGEFEVTD